MEEKISRESNFSLLVYFMKVEIVHGLHGRL